MVLGFGLSLRADTVPDGVFVWTEDWDSFGGFSAIEVTDDGMGFVALSDRALAPQLSWPVAAALGTCQLHVARFRAVA